MKLTILGSARYLILAIAVVVIEFCSLFQPNPIRAFAYRGEARWSGVLDNPNLFGILMAVGFVILFGLSWHDSFRHRSVRFLLLILWFVAALVCGIGLLRSYSRGAWLGVLLGCVSLAMNGSRFCSGVVKTRLRRLRCEGIGLGWLAIGLLTLFFWNSRETELLALRRLFSIGNVNDFSWRRRVDGWEGAMRVIAKRPWLGSGWQVPEQTYYNYFLRPKISEGQAIQLNDYLMLAMTWGVPLLVCFAVFVWSAFGLCARPPTKLGGLEVEEQWLQTTCRAGVVVFLVGFWFDGGLFRWALAVPFWVLLELGRSQPWFWSYARREARPGSQ